MNTYIIKQSVSGSPFIPFSSASVETSLRNSQQSIDI